MLKSIHIKNFRSCKDLKLEGIESLLVLIGRNGAGKSNILKAIQWLSKILSKGHESKATNLLTPHNISEMKVQFELENNLYEYHVNYSDQINFSGPEGKVTHQITYIEKLSEIKNLVYTTLLSRDGEMIGVPALSNNTYEVSNNISSIKAMQSLLPEENHFRQTLDSISKFFSSITYYPLEINEPEFRAQIITGNQYENWVHGKTEILNPAEVVLVKILHLYLANRERYDELLSLVGDDGLGIIRDLTITDFEIPIPSGDDSTTKPAKLYFFAFSPCGHNKEKNFQIGDLSFGTKRVLNFVVALLYDSASVSLIEQIEDGVHEALVDKLIPLIRGYADNAQFVLASHSTAVFNRLKPEEVRIVELDNGITTSRALTKQEINSALKYLQSDGPFSEFLQSL